jgi:predicted lysophospholipase L1 biosynthesis ABC-type transport system permease subunit
MEREQQSLADLAQIRNLMERSSRFLSLSGLSGVFAGIYALIGAAIVYFDVKIISSKDNIIAYSHYITTSDNKTLMDQKLYFLMMLAAVVLLLSILTGYVFSRIKSKKMGLKLWDNNAKRLVFHLFIPLIAGGFFCLFLIKHGALGLVAPATLLFYGLALLNASKFTFKEIQYLAICEIILGILGCYFYGMGLLFWSIGFGVLHIVYGALMYFKYERNSVSK